MNRVTLGNCGLRVSELIFGTLCMGTLQSKMPVPEGGKVMVRAVELGIDCIDTAQLYGTYEHVAYALRELGRDAQDVKIISKSHAKTAQEMQQAVDEARTVLKRDRIEVFHLHGVASREDFDSRRGALETLIKLKSQGVIRAIAISVHCLAGLEGTYDCEDIDVVMPSINRLGMGVSDGTLDDMLAACRRLKASGKGVYAMKPIAGGHLHASVEESVNFVRELPEVDAVALGIKTMPELEMDVTIFENKPVPAELLEQVKSRPKKVLIYPICIGCGACIETCQQEALTLVNGKAVVDMSKCILCGYCAEECPKIAIRVV